MHVEVYSGVELGKDWRVDETKNSKEIYKASQGLAKVSRKFDRLVEKQEASSVLGIVKRLFQKR
ncbi:MAG: hypothetical protein AAF518_01375 [Spirochaetota bacterium]